MDSQKQLILDGYGNAGLALARLQANLSDHQIILAGRRAQLARAAAGRLDAEFGTDRFSGLEVNVANRESLWAACRQMDLVIVASSTNAGRQSTNLCQDFKC